MNVVSRYLRRHLFKTPDFWDEPDAPLTGLLRPVAKLYAALSRKRAMRPARFKSDLPVICVGNVTVGGSGKTPTVQMVANLLKACGKRPAILLRGYGGSEHGPVQIDVTQHNAQQVGDEALLHVHVAPTWVARDREAGAKAIQATGLFDCIIMDDGAQNPALHKDLILHVVDGGSGFGNHEMLPAGPLREELRPALERAGAIILIGTDKRSVQRTLKNDPVLAQKPVFAAQIVPTNEIALLKGKKFLAFAGIGRPAKFYQTLRQHELDIVATADFPDHHPYNGSDIKQLAAQAKDLQADLITTTKDWVRIPAGYQHLAQFLPVELQVERIDDLTQLLLGLWR